jgi:hypothetical protein
MHVPAWGFSCSTARMTNSVALMYESIFPKASLQLEELQNKATRLCLCRVYNPLNEDEKQLSPSCVEEICACRNELQLLQHL